MAVLQTSGSHGYINSDPDLDAIFIASGVGIRTGSSVERIANLDVAPTVAQLLGVKMDRVQGHAISEILK